MDSPHQIIHTECPSIIPQCITLLQVLFIFSSPFKMPKQCIITRKLSKICNKHPGAQNFIWIFIYLVCIAHGQHVIHTRPTQSQQWRITFFPLCGTYYACSLAQKKSVPICVDKRSQPVLCWCLLQTACQLGAS
jgi:hypothetical protein